LNSIDFLKEINDIDADMLAAADITPVKRKVNISSLATIAACVCLIATLGIFTVINANRPSYQNTVISFSLNDRQYEPFTLQDYVTYGLVEEDSQGRSAIGAKPIKAEDLGELMGTIAVSTEGKERHYEVFHHADFPGDDKVCIIKYANGEYQVFVVKE